MFFLVRECVYVRARMLLCVYVCTFVCVFVFLRAFLC